MKFYRLAPSLFIAALSFTQPIFAQTDSSATLKELYSSVALSLKLGAHAELASLDKTIEELELTMGAKKPLLKASERALLRLQAQDQSVFAKSIAEQVAELNQAFRLLEPMRETNPQTLQAHQELLSNTATFIIKLEDRVALLRLAQEQLAEATFLVTHGSPLATMIAAEKAAVFRNLSHPEDQNSWTSGVLSLDQRINEARNLPHRCVAIFL